MSAPGTTSSPTDRYRTERRQSAFARGVHLLGAMRRPGHPGFVEATLVSGSRVFASGAIFAALALALGGGHLSIAVIAAIPFLSRTAHLLVPLLLRHHESWRVAVAAAWLERAGLLAAALAGIVRPEGWALTGFLTGLAVALLGQAVYDVALASLHSEATAPRGFGRYTATKTRWAAISGLVLGIVASFAVDATERFGVPPHVARSLAIVAGVAIHMAIARPLAGLRLFARRQAARGHRAAARAPAAAGAPGVEQLRRPIPWGVVRFAVAWGFALGISTRQGEAMAISVLGLSVGALTMLNALLVGGGVLGAKTWGVLADRFGGKGLMSIALCAIALDPLWVLAAMLVHPLLLVPGYAIYGVFNSGWNIATTITLIGTAGPPAERIRSLIVYSVAFGAAAGTAPLLGGLLLEVVDAHFSTTVAYGALFVLAALLRLSAYPLLRLMPAPPARRGRYVSVVVLRAIRRDARRRGVAGWASAARDVARLTVRRSA